MHEMRTVATDDPIVLCLSVCHPPAPESREQIEVLFGMETLGSPRHIVLDGGSDLLTGRVGEGGGENFSHCAVQAL